MEMVTIILVSHGELSQGLKQTATMIIGDSIPIYALSAFRDEDEPVLKQINRMLRETDTNNTYILTDILGGSVNNDMMTIIKEHPEIQLITGMNLPLVISLATHCGPINENDLSNIILESQNSLVDCKKLLVGLTAEGDEL
jgi:fructoselysine and glucoselysine-specific PTS system IIA component